MAYLLTWSLTLLLYSPVFYQLYAIRWHLIDYTHAYFVLPVALLLAYRNRKALVPNPAFTDLSLFLLVFGLWLFVFGFRQDFLLVSTLSLVPVLFGLILYLYGQEAAKEMSFPIWYLLLLVPPPLGLLDAMTLPLRYAATFGADLVLKFFEIPVVRDGLILSLRGHEIYMGTPCSGLHSLTAMLALGLVYVYLLPLKTRSKIWLVLAIIPLSLIGNFIRILATCFEVYFWGPSMAEGTVHFINGLLVFLLMIACFIALEKRLEDSELHT